MDWKHTDLYAAPVEGVCFHWEQHRGGSDDLGRAVDDLRGAEHRPDAVQGL